MKQILSITRKELEGYFGSPLAIIFLGAFLTAELFIFFSVETFFARGIADVRPLFQWMPILLIFLLAALTMRQWSEEQNSGTLEILLTLPVKHIKLVLGKFIAVMVLISMALLLTMPLPITVSLLGILDWGPVMGGYLAALLMAGAYAAIGLFVSSRTNNQIVALISTVLLGGLFYLVGTRGVTDFFGGSISEILWSIGTGSRFESIERGVIDLRDLIYYLSLTGIFLLFNTISLDRIRWSLKQFSYRRKVMTTTALIGLNLIMVNVWLFPLHGLRVDLTAQKEYTISQASKDLLENLNEPLLMRAYISEKTHPLLAPLAPQVRDMLREYEIASQGMVTAEFLDPLTDAEIEAEANQTYGIRPTPFQIAGRHETSVINSYFDILIRYGDQSLVLSFGDMIEISPKPDGGLDVSLRNLEYDLTRAVKKVVYGFQSVDAVLAELDQPVRMTLYETPQMIPDWLLETEELIRKVSNEIQADSNGKLLFEVINPDTAGSLVTRQSLYDTYGLQPIPTDIFGTQSFYLHLVLENQDQIQFIYPSGEMTEGEIRTEIETSLKRTSAGFLNLVGLWTPPETPTQNAFGQMQQPLSTYQMINEQLGQEYNVNPVDLSTGHVPANIDVLVVVSPQNFTDNELFAIDQYLMRGGSVVMAVSTSKLSQNPVNGSLMLQPVEGGVKELLKTYNINVSDSLVMDKQNVPFPVVVNRQAGEFQVQEIQAIDYPFFVDVRPDGMDTDSLIVSRLPAVTMNWVSPVELIDEQDTGRETSVLLKSSPQSWLRSSFEIQPNFELYPELGFEVGEETQSHSLAVSSQGAFESYFKGKPSPLLTSGEGEETLETLPAQQEQQYPVIEQSPETARLIVVGSSSFVDDFVLDLSSKLSQELYLNNLSLLQNMVDWSVEDVDLLTIRSRGAQTHVLLPLGEGAQTFWEIVNYAIALAALIAIYLYWNIRKKNEQPMELVATNTEAGIGKEE